MTISANGLPFTEAVDYFRAKTNIGTKAWTDLYQQHHARAFTVAGAMQAGLLEDLRKAVDKAIAEGTTIETFRKDFRETVSKHGWTGWAGEGTRGGERWRTATIFNTNLRMAYNAGRYQRAQELKATRPFLRYVAILDSQTRPEHRAWHNTVLPVDDPWWSTHHPPNGWACRCTVQSLARRDLTSLKLEESEAAPPVELETRQQNTPEGKVTVQVPRGIDTGFAYNPGLAAKGNGAPEPKRMEPADFRDLPMLSAAPAERAPLPVIPSDKPKAALGPRARSEVQVRNAFRQALGADSVALRDPLGQVMPVELEQLLGHYDDKARREGHSTTLGRERYFPLLPEVITDPAEIWASFIEIKASGRTQLRRRYVKRFDLEGQAKDRVTMVFEIGADGRWFVVTAFPGQRDNFFNPVRRGRLLYRRSDVK